ncbi:Maf family protein [Tissierella sp. Yu-01]|uniref:Maf family protein n=1 Tax=Tissierella sp. Yu-01 TaxID=3035694 RepID=UPI00240D439A|nr:Maf family protein [Tissierella sp. Yu-01]WFA09485.1 Maf family protein [Tissierella sp. Yu-01]
MDRIVLASGSPRRKEMLEKYNIEPIIIKSNVEEIINQDEAAEQIAMSLALTKALDVSARFNDDIVIGADTIVVIDEVILGKPNNEEDAFKMLSMLSGRMHEVITGIAIIKGNANKKIIDYELTKVKFRELSNDLINRYIKTKEPHDKAGAYGIQGIGAILVENIDGCYSNVVGLPLTKIDILLNKYFDYKIL